MELGTLFQDKKGNMFVVDEVEKYRYRGKERTRIHFYMRSDTGLIYKTIRYRVSMDKFNSKYRKLDWKFESNYKTLGGKM